jgi:hypothetical protein
MGVSIRRPSGSQGFFAQHRPPCTGVRIPNQFAIADDHNAFSVFVNIYLPIRNFMISHRGGGAATNGRFLPLEDVRPPRPSLKPRRTERATIINASKHGV